MLKPLCFRPLAGKGFCRTNKSYRYRNRNRIKTSFRPLAGKGFCRTFDLLLDLQQF